MLNQRQELFVNYYASGLSGAAAARKAGYKPSRARQTASELLSNPDIQEDLEMQTRAFRAIAARSVLKKAEELIREMDSAGNSRALVIAQKLLLLSGLSN
jgi:phage terminase small subunit